MAAPLLAMALALPVSTAHAAPQGATTDYVGDEVVALAANLGLSFFEPDNIDYGLRIDFFGQFFLNGGNLGFYGLLPIAHFSTEDFSETTLGNIDLGGLYLMSTRRMPLLLRFGLVLPTGGDSLQESSANRATGAGRLADFATTFFDSTWLRFGVSPFFYSDQFFLRFDGGFDLAIAEPDGADFGPLLRVNAMAGFQPGAFELLGELALNSELGDGGDTVSSLAFTLRLLRRDIVPHFSLILPLSDDALGDVNVILAFGLRYSDY